MPQKDFLLVDRYRSTERLIVTAHRGLSGLYPENTLLAFQKAIDIGADLLEFDIRASRDGVPIVLHDGTLERTTNGAGRPEDHDLADLKRLNASFWQGTHNTGSRLEAPAVADCAIPTLREVLELTANIPIGLNIQVYTSDPEVVRKICALYREFGLTRSAYFAMSTYAEARVVREIDPEIGICILERQSAMNEAALDEMVRFGCRYAQPRRTDVTPEYCRACRERGLLANMFFSNDSDDAQIYIDMGLPGILTDRADLLVGMKVSAVS